MATYAPTRLGSISWSVRMGDRPSCLSSVIANPDGMLARAELLKDSGACRVARLHDLVIKRWRPRFKDLLRGPRAGRAWRCALALEAAGIRTAIPFAWGVSRHFGFPGSSYLIMEEIRGDSDFATLREDRAQRFEALGLLIGRLHRCGFTHRDLKPSNIRFLPGGEACLIDLDGVRMVGAPSRRQAVEDLVKFARRLMELARFCPNDAARFLSGYCRSRGDCRRTGWWPQLKAEACRHQEFLPLVHARQQRLKERGRGRPFDPSVH